MTPEQVRQIIREELQRNTSQGRFNVQNIPKHTHNGIDSVPIYSPTLTYTGYIPSDGDVFNSSVTAVFPSGWTCNLVSLTPPTDKAYLITHNLGTNLYTVNVTQVSGAPLSFNSTVTPVVAAASNAFFVFWWDFDAGAFVVTNFHFQLVQPNNKVSPLISYTLNQP